MLMRNMSRALCGLFFMSICMFAALALPSPTFASSNPITVITRTYSIHFPNSVDFQAIASDSSSPINQATIYITFGVEGYLEHYNISITPAKRLTLSWHENTSGSNSFVNPGTPVTYYWQFQDSAGHSYTDAQQQFTLIDSRFSWQHLSKGQVQVDWYNQPQSFGQFMLTQASQDVDRITALLGGSLHTPVNLWIYQNISDFHGALAPNDYEWVGGQAFPDLDEAMIVVASPSDTTVQRDMPHELTHLVFGQLTVHAIDVPAWFNEGLAVYNQLYHEPDLTARLQQALDNSTLLRLDSISGGFPDDSDQAYLAYAQSWNLVSYMYSTFGRAKMRQLIQTISSPLIDFNDSLKQALGVDQLHLENQWHLSLHQPPVIGTRPSSPSRQTPSADGASNAPLIIGVGVLLIALAAIIMTFTFIRRKRKQQPAPIIAARNADQRPTGLQGIDQEAQNTDKDQQPPLFDQYREYLSQSSSEQRPQTPQE